MIVKDLYMAVIVSQIEFAATLSAIKGQCSQTQELKAISCRFSTRPGLDKAFLSSIALKPRAEHSTALNQGF